MYRHPRPHVLITNSDGKIITVQTCSIISTSNTYIAIHLKYETINIKYQRLKQHFTCLVNWNECNDFTHTLLTLTCPSNQLKYINRPNRSSSTTPNLVLYHCPCTPSCGLPSVWNHTPGIPGRGLQSLSTQKRCIKILSTPLIAIRALIELYNTCTEYQIGCEVIYLLTVQHCSIWPLPAASEIADRCINWGKP